MTSSTDNSSKLMDSIEPGLPADPTAVAADPAALGAAAPPTPAADLPAPLSAAPELDAPAMPAPLPAPATPAWRRILVKLGSGWKWLLPGGKNRSPRGDLAPGDPAWPYYELSRKVLAAVETLEEYPDRQDAALLLMREAVLLSAAAHVLRSDRAAGTRWVEQASDDALWGHFVETAPGAELLERLGSTHATVVRESVLGGRGSQLTRIEDERRRRRARVLVRVARELVQRLEREANGQAWAKTEGRLRLLLFLLLLALPVAAILYSTGVFSPQPNLAFGKPVTVSSHYKLRYFPPEHLVDGDRDAIGFHTDLEDHPTATIDLQRIETVRRVVVTNRRDMEQERAVPLVIETSADGKNYQTFARRDEMFDVWEASGNPVQVRYIRLMAPRRIELHLNEVEVYAR